MSQQRTGTGPSSIKHLREIMQMMERTEMAIDPKVAEWLYEFVQSHPSIQRTLDVGLGEGASAMTVMLATGRRHTAIDSLQFTTAGLRNLARFGFTEQIELLPNLACLALPDLLRSGRRFDYTFLDAGGKLDDLFTDFHYVSAMTTMGGFVLIPDDDRPTVLKFISYLRANRPDFEIIPTSRPVRTTVVKKTAASDRRHWGDFHDF